MLSCEFGIGVRHGAFCAHPLVRDLVGNTAPTPGAVRASIGLGTRMQDVDRLLVALGQISTRGAAWRYRRDEGQIVPDPDPRPRPALAGLPIDRDGRGGPASTASDGVG